MLGEIIRVIGKTLKNQPQGFTKVDLKWKFQNFLRVTKAGNRTYKPFGIHTFIRILNPDDIMRLSYITACKAKGYVRSIFDVLFYVSIMTLFCSTSSLLFRLDLHTELSVAFLLVSSTYKGQARTC